MNNDQDIHKLIEEMSASLVRYADKLDTDNLLAVLIGFCKMIGDEKGIKKKDFRRGLKNIIDYQVVE